ncbi:uncharacterized protein RCO7_00515 [Rhynchosporium graminicola]|uniref:FAD-binding domain-containing protein n=1 Tax=Rhynchosporium graminicola TaxID=2792576 RepID=A0A1E1KQM9_9HELO|nr:uncharacterized protein RCO7_00515 [Rhynchosporium commune]
MSTYQARSKRVRVVIVGGSIAGLTLAHCLHHSDIDFVLLEAHKEIAPEVGASIVLLPNGARVMDQLGMFQDIFAAAEPLSHGRLWTADGELVIQDDGPLLIKRRTGYPVSLVLRSHLLKVLSDHIPDKSKIHLSKRVTKIDHTEDEVVVHCKDGSLFSGEIVVGADGVHSTVKSLMQDHIDRLSPGKANKDRNSLSAEYNCIFGLGRSIPGTLQAVSHRTYAKGISALTFVGEGGKMSWFLFSKLDKKFFGKDIPKYTQEDMGEAIKPFLKLHMTDSITFDQLWETRTYATMTCIEESKNANWTADRFVCLGDAIHKMTPNLGAGGNAAIESAAALANSLATLPKHTLSVPQIQHVLRAFYDQRHDRANKTLESANKLTRVEALSNFGHKIMAFYVFPYLGDLIIDMTCDAMVGAEILEALPPPTQSLEATMPWNPNFGAGKHESKWKRAVWALPILLALYAASQTMGLTIDNILSVEPVGETINFGNGMLAPVGLKYFGNPGFDAFLVQFVAFFTPVVGDWSPITRLQAYGFFADLVSIQTIWYIEGLRRGNVFTAAHLLPTLFGIMYQIRGIGYIAPIYCFLHYIQSPLENYAAADNRMAQISGAKTIIPTVVLSYVIPTLTMFFIPGLANRQWVNGIFWQPFPVYGAILQRILPTFVKDTTQRDRISNPTADMPHLRAAYRFSTAVGALTYFSLHLASPIPLSKVFFGNLGSPSAALPLIEAAVKALRYDQICAFSATAIWTLLSFKDLKRAGKLQAGWARIVGSFVAMNLVIGPGAALSIMWAWREEILAARQDLVKKDVW